MLELKMYGYSITTNLKEQSEGLNLHIRTQAKRSLRSKYHAEQHSERVNIKKVQSSRLVSDMCRYPRVALRLTPGYENVVFQTITSYANIQLYAIQSFNPSILQLVYQSINLLINKSINNLCV